jgi:RNA polymerase sigma factor (sigma-70 family)
MVMAGDRPVRLAHASCLDREERWSERPGEVDWQFLYEQYADPLRRLIARRLPHNGPVEDVLQEAYARGIRSTESIDTTRPPWPFLATVAGRAVADWWTREGTRASVHVPAEPLADRPGEDFPGSDEHAHTLDRTIRARRALLALTPRHRRALYLYEGADWSYETLVALDRTTPKAMKSLLGRARARFEEHCRRLALGVLVWRRTLPGRLRERAAWMSVTSEGLTVLGGAVVATLVAGVATLPFASATSSTVQADAYRARVQAEAEERLPPRGVAPPEIGRATDEPTAARPDATASRNVPQQEQQERAPVASRPVVVSGGGGLVNTPEESTASFWLVTVEGSILWNEKRIGMETRCEEGEVAAHKCEAIRFLAGSS